MSVTLSHSQLGPLCLRGRAWVWAQASHTQRCVPRTETSARTRTGLQPHPGSVWSRWVSRGTVSTAGSSKPPTSHRPGLQQMTKGTPQGSGSQSFLLWGGKRKTDWGLGILDFLTSPHSLTLLCWQVTTGILN